MVFDNILWAVIYYLTRLQITVGSSSGCGIVIVKHPVMCRYQIYQQNWLSTLVSNTKAISIFRGGERECLNCIASLHFF